MNVIYCKSCDMTWGCDELFISKINRHDWVCQNCNQPERSKREDVVDNGPFFPPPWNISEHPEKTEGWIEFQRAMKKDPKYYLDDAVL